MGQVLQSPEVTLNVRAVAQNEWAVNYNPKSVCALTGSKVRMGCTYTYPSDLVIKKTMWTKEWPTDKEPPDLLDVQVYRNRTEYLGDKQHNCTLRLSNVTKMDQSKYYFRFITDQTGGKWTGENGVDLSVTGLQVEVPERVIEGDKVTLTCKTSCSLTNSPTFTWYKNGHIISTGTQQLQLQSVSREDKSRYHCGVMGQVPQSPEVTLNVRAVAQNEWAVNYNPKSVCALTGSKVRMGCTYTYPSDLVIKKTMWTKEWPTDKEPPDLLDVQVYRNRTEYLGDKQHNCTLRLSNVTKMDQSKYYFRFITDQTGGKWTGENGVDLSVTGLQVEVPERVIEGDKVTLTCKTSCSLTNSPTFTWYKNGHIISTGTQQLQLQSVSREDKSRYHCGVMGQVPQSPEVTLNVNPPKSVIVSIRPSGEIVEYSSVTLTCSSDDSPPGECMWFKGTLFLSKGETYTIIEISSVDSGEYKCKCSNAHIVKYSDALTLNVLYPPKNTSVAIRPSGEIVEGSSVTLTCSSDANPPVQNYTWFKDAGLSAIGSGQHYSFMLDSNSVGRYYCLAQNKHGSEKSSAALVNVNGDYLMVLSVAFGISLCAVVVLLSVVFWMSRKKRQTRKTEEHDYQNVDPIAMEDTYTALDTMSRSPEYDTLAIKRTQICHVYNAEKGGVARSGWSVNYTPQSICALKGSTVNMGCTYTYPWGHSVQRAFWTKDLSVNGVEPPDLLNAPEYRDRVQFTGDKQHNCTLTLRDVKENDQSKYYFRFITYQTGGKWTGAGGVDFSVTDLQVEVPETVTEGDKVTLTCKTSCSLTDSPTFTWYKNGHGLSSRTDQLLLQSVSRWNKDRYHCAVRSPMYLKSPEVTLNVRYGPKSVSMSIRPSGETVEDSSVTLTCSSDANPPPECNWFKGTSFLSKGGNYTMNRIRSVDSGKYKCKCSNEHGEIYSEALTLNVLYPPKSVSVSLRPSGETVEDSSVTLTCSSDANPPPECNWFKGTSFLSKGENYTMNRIRSVDSGEYKCKCSNEHGEKYSEARTLNVLYPPKSVSVSIRPSGETVEDSSVTLTCSSDGNPPVQNYTWFKEGETSPVGSGHSYSALQSGSYYCVAQNEYGAQTTAAVSVSIKGFGLIILYAVLGVIAGCLCTIAIIAILCLRKKRTSLANNVNQKQEHIYSNVGAAADPVHEDEDYYSNVVPQKVNNPRNAERADEEVQYACIPHHPNNPREKTEEGSVDYASIRFTCTGEKDRIDSAAVIYSSVS
ncbi:sialoadhesin-like [Hoplias malabaricus]|uniref:sialoadhesin-like n=1 Tax=Hoplias malabaricus TaxID=27720 RepID=UPI0034637A67